MKNIKFNILFLVFLLINSSLIFSQIHRRADIEIKKVFSIENYQLDRVINQNFEDFLSKRLLLIKTNNEKIGYAYLGTAPSQTKYFDYIVLFDKDLVIQSIKILVYREDYGGEIGSKRWLNQFIGKTFFDKFIYRKNVAAISGATISVNSMTDAVNDILSYLKSLKNKGVI
ncbi:MAG: FMN-binding protein [Bacteroidetes bacterium]|nr:FMN-binding protein [Bacteroidota bacterium]MDA1226197.1 FMN-binding protein [Bacteroidota bacterium]